MSCNGCRVLRKGCSDNCMLRQCLQWIENPQAQAHATVFVAKFFGRACLMSFISGVPERQRPGNWKVCQSAVETVLQGGALRVLPEFLGDQASMPEPDVDASGAHGNKQRCAGQLDLDLCLAGNDDLHKRKKARKRRSPSEESETTTLGSDYTGGNCITEGSGSERKILRLFV
ncbi:LOB domain-containing protein 38-like isoform X2 [Juglans microcarpa x Juglans regia]|uniref:LOB domain-containing protein 38-like isoform X2 n=1 Tax=Juglans microcarpa x Juglans regia TaxID=2249226 RepID=UPI001B7EE7A9|nr:LOB domain-containing protein 38-like isoform X2 [Juglans microcarpa x Juglans regia]